MSLEKGGWDVHTVGCPPIEVETNKPVTVVIDYFPGWEDGEPMPKYDTVSITPESVRSYPHWTSIRGIVLGGAVEDLIHQSVLVVVDNRTRKGILEVQLT